MHKAKVIVSIIIVLFIHLGSHAQKYRNLVMEGGGIKGIAYGGALQELENKGILQGIVRTAGTSAGAIQACLLALGYSPSEITDIISNTPVESFNDDGFVLTGSKRLINKFGWYKGDSFLLKMEEVIQQRTGNPNLTFRELHQLAQSYPFRDLYVTGCNLTKQKIEVFSYETHPEMRVADAVRISMSIPLYYRGVWVNEQGKISENPLPGENCSLFVDGGLLMNFPVALFDNKKYFQPDNEKSDFNPETLGLRLERCEQIEHEVQKKEGLAPFEITDFSSYMSALSGIIMRNVNTLNPRDAERTIYINDLGVSARVRKVPEDEKKRMMLSGRQGVIDFFGRYGSH
jgi:NTE family protein